MRPVTTPRRPLASLALGLLVSAPLVAVIGCGDGVIGEPAPAPDATADAPILYDYLNEGVEKFNASGSSWQTTDLTWCISTYTPDLAPQTVRDTLTAAWNEWSRVSPLTFRFIDDCRLADLEVVFAARAHGDGEDFDGPDGVLAHAYFPRDGRIHFDEDELWTQATRSSGGGAKDLQTVALHEFGHALGLRHSDVRDAVMYAYYGGSLRDLREDDLRGVQSIYGQTDAQPTGDDHPNGFANASPMPVGSTLDGVIDLGGDVDFFAFDANFDGSTTISTTGSTDTVCTLYDASQNPIAENDDADNSRNCRIDMDLQGPARYFVRVKHYDPARGGAYTISVEGSFPEALPQPDPQPQPQPPANPDQGNTFETATPIADDATLDAAFNPAGDNDFVRFTASVSGAWTIQTAGAMDTVCELYDARRAVVAANDDTSRTNLNCTIQHTLTAGQTYVLRVRHYDARATGAYTLTLSRPATIPAAAADADGDGIPNAQDRCSNTPAGAPVWPSGDWMGCAGGQFVDR